MTEKDTCIHVAQGEFDAQQVKAFLAAHDIPCTFQGEALRNVHGFTLDGLGEVRIHVAAELVGRARELMAQAKSGELSLDTLPDSEPS